MNKKLCIYLIILFFVFSFSAEAQNVNYNNFSGGVNLYYQGRYSEAEAIFSEILNDPSINHELKHDTLYYYTLTALDNNHTQLAIEQINTLKELGYENGRLYWKLGALFLNKDHQFDSASFDSALKNLQKASKLGVNSIPFKRDLAAAYTGLNEKEKAKKLYGEIISINPTVDDYLNLALLNKELGNLETAVKYYESALDIDSTRQTIYLNLGNLYQELNNYNAAVSIYKQGIKLQKNFTPFYVGLGESYIALEKYNEAENVLKQVIEINRHSYYSYFLLGMINRKLEDYDTALDYYDQAIKYNEDYVNAYLEQGKIYLNREEYYKAISKFSIAVGKNTKHAESHYYLALAYYGADMKEAAVAELKRTLHLNNKYPNARKLLNEIEKQ
ncbi:tetratricopeptide repeat protein [Halanaerobium sp. DL-01]|uniref:tetratricopeptide repeat protein n=1 Tax=Halanaerobium sp. DL-01 TaxID=1653064 RepID=UPI000DF3DEA4|nr:tetratricopeptide repeat protein [Halanaerobium sp. DL-01]RCW89303.1 tetratricopeptide repeat protein [Halanaerobium sp. DL-01]